MEVKLQLTSKTNEAFLRMVMNANKTGIIPISRSNEVGKYIHSRVRYSNIPIRQSSGTLLKIPIIYNHPENYFLYFTVDDQIKINDYLESIQVVFFREVMLEGREMGIKYTAILEMYIAELKLHENAMLFERFKKSDYRNRKRKRDFIEKSYHKFINQ